jgi:hypothetical protein
MLAVCMVTFHILGGCCWHHDHAECLSCAKDDDHTSANLDFTLGESDCKLDHCHMGCDQSDCAFAEAQSRRAVEVIGKLVASSVMVPHGLQALSAVQEHHRLDGLLPASSPPLRLHLINQTFLL